jgi:hypothetical protein
VVPGTRPGVSSVARQERPSSINTAGTAVTKAPGKGGPSAETTVRPTPPNSIVINRDNAGIARADNSRSISRAVGNPPPYWMQGPTVAIGQPQTPRAVAPVAPPSTSRAEPSRPSVSAASPVRPYNPQPNYSAPSALPPALMRSQPAAPVFRAEQPRSFVAPAAPVAPHIAPPPSAPPASAAPARSQGGGRSDQTTGGFVGRR